MSQGYQILWPHNSPSKPCCLVPRTKRRVLMSLGSCRGLSSPILDECQGLFACLRHTPSVSVYGASPHQYFLWRDTDHFGMWGTHSLVFLWSGADLAVEGFLENWARFISLVILSLSFVRINFPLDRAFYIRHLGRIILLHLQTTDFYKNSKFIFPLMNRECRLDPGRRS